MSAGGKSTSKGLSRSRARLAAVQALYQMDLAETDLGAVLEEFSANPLVDDTEAQALERAQGGRKGKGAEAVRACLALVAIEQVFADEDME